MNKIDDLKWIRIFTPSHIPKYLIEQVRDRDYSVEDFYKYHEINCLLPSKEGDVKLNPFSHLYVLANSENTVKGALWFCIDPLTKDVVIQTFTMDKEYWNKGYAVKKLANHIKEIKRKGNLNKIYWITNYPKHSERNGFKRAKSVLMEYNEECEAKENKNEEHEVKNGKNLNGRDNPRGKHQFIESPTTELSEQHIRAPAAAVG